MGKFINRQEELAFLEQEYLRHGSSLVIVYGRRRVGKTALLAEFIKNRPAVYFLATEENETQNRAAFQKAVAEQAGIDFLLNMNCILCSHHCGSHKTTQIHTPNRHNSPTLLRILLLLKNWQI